MFAWKKYRSTEEIMLDTVLRKLDRIEQRVTAIIEADIARNEKPVSPAKAPKKVTTKKK